MVNMDAVVTQIQDVFEGQIVSPETSALFRRTLHF